MYYQGDERMGQATCTRLLTLLVTMLIHLSLGSEVAATDTTEAMIPALRLEVQADGTVVFLNREGAVVGWIPEGTSGQTVVESLAATPPQLPGWPVSVGEVEATPTVADIDGDGPLEVVFPSASPGFMRVYAYDASGLQHAGWPPPHEIRTGFSASVADVDGDGQLETFIGSGPFFPFLYGFEPDGSLVPGWPQEAGGLGFLTVAIDDLDGDGVLELAAADQGHAYLWGPDGSARPGWPVAFPSQFDAPNKGPAIGDMDGDGIAEIAHGVASFDSLHVYRFNGTSLPGYPIGFPFGLRQGVSMADGDGDSRQELWLQLPGGARVLDIDGNPLPGWPVPTMFGNAAPAVGDLDGDGHLEMVWGTVGGDARVYVLRDDGTIAPGWPIVVPTFSFNAQATLGDIDGDGAPDVVLGGITATFSSKGRIYAWHADGTPVEGFPFSVPEGKGVLGSAVTITDLDQDGDVDLLVGTITGFGGTNSGGVFAFDLAAPYNATTMEWPTLAHDIRHTSRYEPPPRLAAHAGFDAQVECTSPAGAVVMLDGSHSADKDSTSGTNDDIELFEWFEHFGTPAEAVLGTGEKLQVAMGLGSHELTLRVRDSQGEQATDSVRVSVVDTQAPAVLLSEPILWPPNHRMVTVTAEVQDACGETLAWEFISVGSSEPDDAPGMGDGKTTGDVVRLDDRTFELRAERDGAGEGRAYRLAYETQDSVGNAATRRVEVVVPHDLGGTVEPLMLGLSETPSGTLANWGEVPGASSYDAVRGDLRRLQEFNGSYHVLPLTCIVAGITETTTASLEDPEQPHLGEGFFYLVGYDDGTRSGYGTESAAKERFVPPGQDCR